MQLLEGYAEFESFGRFSRAKRLCVLAKQRQGKTKKRAAQFHIYVIKKLLRMRERCCAFGSIHSARIPFHLKS